MITVLPEIRPSLEHNPGRVLIMPTVEGAPYKKKIPALNISPQAIFEDNYMHVIKIMRFLHRVIKNKLPIKGITL